MLSHHGLFSPRGTWELCSLCFECSSQASPRPGGDPQAVLGWRGGDGPRKIYEPSAEVPRTLCFLPFNMGSSLLADREGERGSLRTQGRRPSGWEGKRWAAPMPLHSPGQATDRRADPGQGGSRLFTQRDVAFRFLAQRSRFQDGRQH